MTVAVLLVLSNFLLPLLIRGQYIYGDIEAPGTSGLEVAIRRLIYLFVLLQVILRPSMIVRGLSRNPFIGAVAALAILSALWSSRSLLLQLRLTIGFVAATLLGFYLSDRYGSRRLLQLLGWLFGFAAIASFLICVVFPEYGRMSVGWYDGAWRGAFRHKNQLGNQMVFGFWIFLLLTWSGPGPRKLMGLLCLLAFGLIVASRSATALVSASVMLLLVPLWVIIHRKRDRVALLGLAFYLLAAVSIFLVGQREALLTLIGRDLTLPGRTQLWGAVVGLIAERPILGHGFDSFLGPGGGLAEDIGLIIGWAAPSTHNGLLGIAVDLGAVGLLLFVGGYLFSLVQATARITRRNDATTVWPISFLIALGLMNVTETALYEPYFNWAIFVAVATLPPSLRATVSSPSPGRGRRTRES